MPLARFEKYVDESGEIPALQAALESSTNGFGPYHPGTLALVNELAVAFWRAGEIDRAIGLLDRALDHLTSALGSEHPMRVNALSILGRILFDQHHAEHRDDSSRSAGMPGSLCRNEPSGLARGQRRSGRRSVRVGTR